MVPDKNTIGWWAWVNSPAVGKEVQHLRKFVVEVWTMANGKTDPQEVIDEVLTGNLKTMEHDQ
jgi:hypothetical protein